jgi:hypothetical protein
LVLGAAEIWCSFLKYSFIHLRSSFKSRGQEYDRGYTSRVVVHASLRFRARRANRADMARTMLRPYSCKFIDPVTGDAAYDQ